MGQTHRLKYFFGELRKQFLVGSVTERASSLQKTAPTRFSVARSDPSDSRKENENGKIKTEAVVVSMQNLRHCSAISH